MPRLIEIIGSPGSGKTFICSELEKLKKNDEQIFFHSSNYKNFIKYKNLNPFYKILIKFKVIFIIIILKRFNELIGLLVYTFVLRSHLDRRLVLIRLLVVLSLTSLKFTYLTS